MSNRVLLVEPNVHLATTYRRALESYGYIVMHSTGAQNAVFAVDEQLPDIIVLELQLAAHNGVAFLYELRSYPEWRHIPVVVHTMVAPASLRITAEHMEELGIVRCLYKPDTTLRALYQAVTGVLHRAVEA